MGGWTDRSSRLFFLYVPIKQWCGVLTEGVATDRCRYSASRKSWCVWK